MDHCINTTCTLQIIWKNMRERKTNIPGSSNVVFNPNSVPGMYHQVHTPGDHQGSKSNQHPHQMEKQIKNNTNYWICPLSMLYLSGEHIRTPSACCDSQWEILCRHFGQRVIDFGVLPCFLFSPSHSLLLCYKHISCWTAHPPHSYFMFFLPCIPFQHTVWPPYISFSP